MCPARFISNWKSVGLVRWKFHFLLFIIMARLIFYYLSVTFYSYIVTYYSYIIIYYSFIRSYIFLLLYLLIYCIDGIIFLSKMHYRSMDHFVSTFHRCFLATHKRQLVPNSSSLTCNCFWRLNRHCFRLKHFKEG